MTEIEKYKKILEKATDTSLIKHLEEKIKTLEQDKTILK